MDKDRICKSHINNTSMYDVIKFSGIPEINGYNGDLKLSLDEQLVLSQLLFMYTDYKMDEYTDNKDFSKFIKGYRTWNRLYYKTYEFLGIKCNRLPDQYEVLRNLSIKLIKLLFDKNSFENILYIESCDALFSTFKLIKSKLNYKKRMKILDDILIYVPNEETKRLVKILKLDDNWEIRYLHYIFTEDLSERVYHYINGMRSEEYIL